jgi:hypothetical protein
VKRSSLMFALLLTVMGGVASAATLDQPASSPVSTAAAPADCKASLAKVGIPAFLQTTTPFQVCGACSDSVCQGKTIGQFCPGSPVNTWRCQNVYGNTCGDGTGHSSCQCWTGPLP